MNDNTGSGFEDNVGVMHVHAHIFDNHGSEQHWSYDRLSGTWGTSTY